MRQCSRGPVRGSVADVSGSEIEFGPYRILERLGEGGMCHVFRARRADHERDCALKVLKDEWKGDAKVRQMFTTEADLSLMLEHSTLVKGLDAGEVGDRMFLALELVDGASLGAAMRETESKGFPLPIDLGLFVVSEVLDGLHAMHEAHSAGGEPLHLVHRDVTPDNVFLGFDGRVLIGDLGVVQVQAYGDSSDVPLGKLGYMAPEMLQGEAVDRRADVFAAGVIAYELLTGHAPFSADEEREALSKLAEARCPRPSHWTPDMDPELEQLLMKALARRPKDRFESAEIMLLELEPHWSKMLGNPFAVRAMLSALRPYEAQAWRSSGRSTGVSSVWPKA
jgi:eukaryotic-like serine/threonine-protein kinase